MAPIYKARGYHVVADPQGTRCTMYVAWWRVLLIRILGRYGL